MMRVVGAAEMDHESFWKHINMRHLRDMGEPKPMPWRAYYARNPPHDVVSVYRAFHARVHRIASPGQHNHEHIGEN